MARLEPIPTWALSLDDDRARAAIFDWLQRLNDSVEDSLTLQNEAGCIFEYSSTTVCKLNPTRSGAVPVYIGGKLSFIDVPSAGVSFRNNGLSSSTLYYAYVYWTGTALVGEFSTTGHTDSNGVETKSDDQTRTLVGMVYTTAFSNFEDSSSQRHVATWYNRKLKFLYVGTAATNVSSATYVSAMSGTNGFLIWGDDKNVVSGFYISGYSSVAGDVAGARIVFDGTGYNPPSIATVPSINGYVALSVQRGFGLTTEGRHTIGIEVNRSSGTGTVTFPSVSGVLTVWANI